MGALIERLALILIAKGVEATLAWALAAQAVGEASPGGDMAGDPAIRRCRMRSDPRVEDDCYSWDEPSDWSGL